MTSPVILDNPQCTRIASTCLLLVALAGCGGSDPAPAPVAAAPPPRAPAPREPSRPAVTPVAQLMDQLGIDHRVSLPEDKAPATDAARKAVLEFFDNFARGDDKALESMLSTVDRTELDELVKSGAWSQTTAQITNIEVRTGQSPDGQPCAVAVYFVGNDFQPQMWYYKVDGDGATFDAVATPPNLLDRISGNVSDWIAAWFDILHEEMALADKPDEEFVVPQKNVTETGSSGRGAVPSGPSGPGTSPNPAPGKPSAPPGVPGRRAPTRGKRPAPGKG